MKTRPVLISLGCAALLTACSAEQEPNDLPDEVANEDLETSVPPPPPTEDAGEDASENDSLTAPKLTPEAEKGEKGARNVLLTWARALENGDFARAYAQWGEDGERSGMSAADYARQYAQYERITVTVGLGEIEGAAGSLYYQVPVTISGILPTGNSEVVQGPVTVRRVNDVPGATEAQLRWHIDRAGLEPVGN